MGDLGKAPSVLVTSVPAEAKGGIFALQQVLFGDMSEVDPEILLYPVGSSKPFHESTASRTIRVIKLVLKYIHILNTNRSIKTIHINTAYDPRALLRDALFIVVSRMFKKKIILQIHQLIPEENTKLANWTTKYVMSACDKILVFSAESKKNMANMLPIEKIEIFPNAVVVKDFLRKDNSSYKKELSVPEGGKVVLFLSRFVKEKGVYDVIESISHVAGYMKDVYFVFSGDGPERSGMEEKCKEMGVEDKVRFTGHIPYDDVLRAYGCADIFVLPTYYSEGMPMVILQALAAGLPIVSCPTATIPDIVEHGVNGYLVDPRSPDQLAEKIITLLKDDDLRNRMGEANTQLAFREYDRDLIKKKLLLLYASV